MDKKIRAVLSPEVKASWDELNRVVSEEMGRGIKQIPKICIPSFATLTSQQAVGYFTNFQDGIFIITFYVASYGVLNSKCNKQKF